MALSTTAAALRRRWVDALLGLLLLVTLALAVPARAAPAAPATELDAWLLEATLAWSPAYALKAQPKHGVQAETVDEAKVRRAKIVAAVVAVANDPAETSLFKGTNGRAETAAFIASIWSFESNFDKRVQEHHCAGLPKTSCDGGSAWCFGQVHMKDAGHLLPAGWTGRDLELDVSKCARATLLILHAAAKTCSLEGADKFSAYASGACQASPAMRARLHLATSWAKSHPLPATKGSL